MKTWRRAFISLLMGIVIFEKKIGADLVEKGVFQTHRAYLAVEVLFALVFMGFCLGFVFLVGRLYSRYQNATISQPTLSDNQYEAVNRDIIQMYLSESGVKSLCSPDGQYFFNEPFSEIEGASLGWTFSPNGRDLLVSCVLNDADLHFTDEEMKERVQAQIEQFNQEDDTGKLMAIEEDKDHWKILYNAHLRPNTAVRLPYKPEIRLFHENVRVKAKEKFTYLHQLANM